MKVSNNIREMKSDEIDIILDIWLKANITSQPLIDENFWYRSIEKIKTQIVKEKVYIYELNEEIVGIIVLSGNYINYLCVKDKYKRQGIGKALIKHCKNNFWSLILKVYNENTTAIEFLKSQYFFVRDKMNNAETNQCELSMEWIR